MKWLLLAWSNLGRNRRRTLATLMLTAIGVTGIMATSGFALYTYESLQEFAMRDKGHVILTHPDFYSEQEDFPLQYGLEEAASLQRTLLGDEEVRDTLATVEFSGLITNGDKSTIFLGEGVEPELFQVRGPVMQLNDGRLFGVSEDNTDAQALIGQSLANNLKVGVGDGLTLMSTTVDGALNAIDVVVRGIVSTGVPEMDSRLVMTQIEDAQRLLNSDRVTRIGVYLSDNDDADDYYRQLVEAYPELGVTAWHERAFFYKSVRNLYNRIFGVMGVVILAMVGFAIFNTASMSVMERIREIGALAAMGTRRREILRLFLMEAGLIGGLGSLVGLALAGLLSLGLMVFEVQMPPPPGQTEGYPLQVYWSLQVAWISSALVIALSVLASGFATLKGVRKPIVEALNYA
ncbi:ABC transporter permease [Saccharospirillum salsuginis]|uniref:ABC transporter permease n=1 Tax=Saccharospirillum salsuginis TaxID=418750 RepID=A0A918NAQ9_9GAMM|nr:FtsX-like permease family protein [Saccharospirillum salsuginis]GGX54312.1 ABC transporter permease [Saccharospirillum salsuginis]